MTRLSIPWFSMMTKPYSSYAADRSRAKRASSGGARVESGYGVGHWRAIVPTTFGM